MSDPILKDYLDTLQTYTSFSEACTKMQAVLLELENELLVKREKFYNSLQEQRRRINGLGNILS